MQSTPEEPHFHSRIKCGEIQIKNERLARYGKPWLIRRAFCVKHQVVICWAADECGWEVGYHFEDHSPQYSNLVRAEAIKRGLKKSFD